MPDPSLSQAWKEAAASAPEGVVFLHTLEFRHQNFSVPIRVVQAHSDLTATLESDAPLNPSEAVTFIAMAFDIMLPEARIMSAAELVIAMDNVAREIEEALASATLSPHTVEVTYRCYLSTDLTAPQNIPPTTMVLRSAVAGSRIEARAGYSNPANLKFPARVYNVNDFPGLRR